MAVKQLSDSRSDGVQMGDSATDLCGFYGFTPVVQPAITAVGTATATTTLNETRITRLYTALVSLGLVNTAG
ncbi:MAG: hypothetical protein ACR2RF_05895 [Geminicoccaceae bacterium]